MKKKVIIIAEAGVNHNGNLDLAYQLIDMAANAGVDYIKFQTFKAENLVTQEAKKASYQIKNLGSEQGGQLEMLKKLEIPEHWHYDLINYSNSKNVKFLSTGFDFESIDLLEKLNVDFFKIPSGEITNKPYLVHVAKKSRPVIISTGMSTLFEISEAISVLINSGLDINKITVLHCNTEYPTPMSDVNLLAMHTIKKEFSVQVGYSDHTLGIEVPIAAVALGATIIEKHITLDKKLPGPDHKASLEPNELIAMVNGIRNIEMALGGYNKEPSPSEFKNIELARKSIVAANFICKGETLTVNNVTTKRPGTGISPMKWDDVIGKCAIKDFVKDEQIII